uniref:Uncharacterized protein n=1 Tax=Pipistrellus kuhlii TaxID=59472 RepID=A0A7J7ZJK0_PIPKU|nr:hypothetical protein mPipKuh1_009651 [Pipistrellus kuhlii]
MRKLRQDEVVALKSRSMVAAGGVKSLSPPGTKHPPAGPAQLCPWFPGRPRSLRGWTVSGKSNSDPVTWDWLGLVCDTRAPSTACPAQARAVTAARAGSGTEHHPADAACCPPSCLRGALSAGLGGCQGNQPSSVSRSGPLTNTQTTRIHSW